MAGVDTTDSDLSSSSEEELLQNMHIRRPKVYKERHDYYNTLSDHEFYERFRLTKPTANMVLEGIRNDIEYNSNRNSCLLPMQQLLLALRFYASGCMLIVIGDFMGVAKATASRTVKRVSIAIARLRPQFVKMPSTAAEIQATHEGFFNIAEFPRVIGTIDCTHIKIQSPGGADGEIYRCRKGHFSLNVQTISCYNLKICNIVARWPGSAHDQTIFNNSSVKMQFENNVFPNCYLLGDSGYRSERYLLTPLLHTNNRPEERYNFSHIRTRNTVERQYGLWKRRFPILRLGMRVNVELAKTITVALAVLHNIAISMNEPEPENIDIPQEENGIDLQGEQIYAVERQNLIHTYFANMR